METEECKNTLDLMQPEVLSVEVLRQVLSQRLSSSDVSDAPKSALVELWHRLVTPLPQRVYRNTRAGRWYAGRQRRPRAVPPSDRNWAEISSVPSGSQLKPSAGGRVSPPLGSTPAPPSVSRLKPPPAADSGKKHNMIRLSGGAGKRSSESSLDDVVIKRRASAGEPRHAPPASAPPGGDPGPPVRSPADEPAATGAAPPAEPASVAQNNGHGDSAGLDCDIKAKLKVEKRKIKIRRKSSAAEPESKRAAVDP